MDAEQRYERKKKNRLFELHSSCHLSLAASGDKSQPKEEKAQKSPWRDKKQGKVDDPKKEGL